MVVDEVKKIEMAEIGDIYVFKMVEVFYVDFSIVDVVEIIKVHNIN